LDAERAAAARLNVLGRRRRGPATIMQWDATRLPLTAGAVDKLVCNLPFGQQIKVDPARLYPALFAEMARVLAVNGRAVILSSEYDQVKESVRRQPTLHIQTGYSMAILGRWGRIYLIQKQ
ncbi:MAG: hypothetical protein KC425_13020, partial [Anaerolineales bacterium]|nr:hypothetical protein [Anaerolineales bacterium]